MSGLEATVEGLNSLKIYNTQYNGYFRKIISYIKELISIPYEAECTEFENIRQELDGGEINIDKLRLYQELLKDGESLSNLILNIQNDIKTKFTYSLLKDDRTEIEELNIDEYINKYNNTNYTKDPYFGFWGNCVCINKIDNFIVLFLEQISSEPNKSKYFNLVLCLKYALKLFEFKIDDDIKYYKTNYTKYSELLVMKNTGIFKLLRFIYKFILILFYYFLLFIEK